MAVVYSAPSPAGLKWVWRLRLRNAKARYALWIHGSALAFLLLAFSAHAACTTHRVADLPLTLWHDKLLVPVGLNGSPETMALDTGAGITVLSGDAAGRLNVPHDFDHHAEIFGAGGAGSALFIGQVDTLSLDQVRFDHQSFPIVDFPMRDGNGRLVAGLLGADVLSQFDVDLDIAGGRLALWRASGCDTVPPPWDANAEPVAIALDAGHHIQLPLKVDGVLLMALLDTGAGGFIMTTRAGMRAGATEEDLESDPQLHGTGVNNRAWSGRLHRFHSVHFGPAAFSNVYAALLPSTSVAQYDALIGADGLIGMQLLRGMRLWISYRSKTLYVQQSRTGSPD